MSNSSGRLAHKGRTSIGRRLALAAAGASVGFIVLGGLAAPRTTLAAGQAYTNSFNYGSPTTPQSIVPADMDVQIHRRDPSNAMEPMDAGHGVDCSAPPAAHPIATLAQGVFICKNHMMTSIVDSGYGEIALTPNRMADWSGSTTTLTFNVSTQQDNGSDWLEIWITPFTDNRTLPFEDQIIDFQGPPKNAIVFSLNQSTLLGTHSGDVSLFQNYVQGNILPKVACTWTGDPLCINPLGTPSVVSPSAAIRSPYQIDISSGHIKFGLPGVVTWTDSDVRIPFSQGIVQLVHHSYNPVKHDPGTGIDTYHWSSLSISNAIPFTIINGAERSTNAGTPSAMNFPTAAPTGSFLRFSALGTISISTDGGSTYVPAVLQEPMTHIEHFTSYMTAIPAGTRSVLVRGTDNAYGQPWWVRDPAIWSLTTPGSPPAPASSPTPSQPPVMPSPFASPTPTPPASPTPASGQGSSSQPTPSPSSASGSGGAPVAGSNPAPAAGSKPLPAQGTTPGRPSDPGRKATPGEGHTVVVPVVSHQSTPERFGRWAFWMLGGLALIIAFAYWTIRRIG